MKNGPKLKTAKSTTDNICHLSYYTEKYLLDYYTQTHKQARVLTARRRSETLEKEGYFYYITMAWEGHFILSCVYQPNGGGRLEKQEETNRCL